MLKRIILSILLISALLATSVPALAAKDSKTMGVNVVLNTSVTDSLLQDLGTHGKVRDVLYEINALTMQIKASDLADIQALPYVASANPDAERNGAPVDSVSVTDFSEGVSTWDLDAINVTDYGLGRTVDFDGTGVYVAVLDTGLLDSWRQYFPEERIATQYAKSFGGGGGEVGNVSEQPNKWERDQNSHGTHVTSTILGYSLRGTPINGVAPMATVIPVKVLNQNGSGWSSVVAAGITYVGDLKAGPLANYPVVINMSLGGPSLDAMEQAAIDYAIAQGVIIVASAGNSGTRGMGYPGAYEPVISAAASGWSGLATSGWRGDVVDPTDPNDFFIAAYSSRSISSLQDLDVTAPGSSVVGPYQVNGQISYYYLSGTSMASPHVAGVVALLAQKNPDLKASEAESILEGTALAMPVWSSSEAGAGMIDANAALNSIP